MDSSGVDDRVGFEASLRCMGTTGRADNRALSQLYPRALGEFPLAFRPYARTIDWSIVAVLDSNAVVLRIARLPSQLRSRSGSPCIRFGCERDNLRNGVCRDTDWRQCRPALFNIEQCILVQSLIDLRVVDEIGQWD